MQSRRHLETNSKENRMKFVFLSRKFYDDHSHCPEIEQKIDRPYAQIVIELNGLLYAIPFRSHIRHPFAFITDKENQCGLDFSKTVVILDLDYIDQTRHPHIRPNEFKAVRNKEHEIKTGLTRYIKRYKKAASRKDVDRNARLCEYSTLQYFEEYL